MLLLQNQNNTMKKFLSIIVISILSTTFLMAQKSKEQIAKDILNGVSAKYRSYDIIKTDFTYTLQNTKAKINETQTGVLYVRSKANKYKIMLAGQEITSDGKVSWTYLKDAKEVQISNVDDSPEAINPAQIFTIYEKGFKYSFREERKVGSKIMQIIDLTPTNSKQFTKVELMVDKVAKQIQEIKLFDRNGNLYTYSVKIFSPNPKITDAFFTFDVKKYPGVDVIDLR